MNIDDTTLRLLENVGAQFHSLEREFQRVFGSEYQLDLLLPRDKHWLLPAAQLYPHPSRTVSHHFFNPLDKRGRLDSALAMIPGLFEIERRVMGRSFSHRLYRRTEGMMETHIRRAEKELKEAIQLRGQRDVDPTRQNAIVGLFLWRLSWLHLWQDGLMRYAKVHNKQPASRARVDNIAALIKPSDVEDAQAAIDAHFRKSPDTDMSEHEDRLALYRSDFREVLLGWWYARLLWKLGADWRELQKIKGTRAMKRKPELESWRRRRRRRSWVEVVKKRLQDAVRYALDKEEDK